MAFLRRGERMLASDQPARIDHSILVAALAAQRGAERSATASPDGPAMVGGRGDDEPMVELLLGGPGWRGALRAQRGCFSRAEAGRRVNGP